MEFKCLKFPYRKFSFWQPIQQQQAYIGICIGNNRPDMENVNCLTQADLFNPNFYPKASKLRQNQIYIKTAENCTLK